MKSYSLAMCSTRPTLTDRPYLAREVLPHGTAPSVNLLDALDRRAQLGVLESAAIAPIARLLGVGTVSLRADLEQSARAFSPPPGPVWDALVGADGLARPRAYGPAGGHFLGAIGDMRVGLLRDHLVDRRLDDQLLADVGLHREHRIYNPQNRTDRQQGARIPVALLAMWMPRI